MAMFVVAVGSTQIGVEVLRRSSERILHNQAYVFIDAVAGGIAATMPEGAGQRRAPDRSALTYRSALLEESMAVRWPDADGRGRDRRSSATRGRGVLLDLLNRNFGGPAGHTEIINDEDRGNRHRRADL